MQRFRGGFVFKAHRLCVSLNSRLERQGAGVPGALTALVPPPPSTAPKVSFRPEPWSTLSFPPINHSVGVRWSVRVVKGCTSNGACDVQSGADGTGDAATFYLPHGTHRGTSLTRA